MRWEYDIVMGQWSKPENQRRVRFPPDANAGSIAAAGPGPDDFRDAAERAFEELEDKDELEITDE